MRSDKEQALEEYHAEVERGKAIFDKLHRVEGLELAPVENIRAAVKLLKHQNNQREFVIELLNILWKVPEV